MEMIGPPSAYTSEQIPITVEITNEDDVETHTLLSVGLHGLDRGDGERMLKLTVEWFRDLHSIRPQHLQFWASTVTPLGSLICRFRWLPGSQRPYSVAYRR
jgi:hypothetical protein